MTVYERDRLDNGMRIVACKLNETRAASVRVFIDGGSRAEPDAAAGAAHFLEHAVFKGTERWPTARDLGIATEQYGGAVDAFTDKDHSGFVVHGPADHIPLFLDVLADLLTAPLLDEVEIERERAVIAEELRSCRDDGDDVAKTQLEKFLWPRHPLGREILGTRSSIRALRREDLQDFRARVFVSPGAIVSIASPWDVARVVDETKRAFARWDGVAMDSPRPAPSPPAGPGFVLEARQSEQTRFRIGFAVPSRRDPRRYALDILATTLAGPATSRLELSLRETLGLVYDISASLEQYEDAGLLSIAAGVQPSRLVHAVRATIDELRSVRASFSFEEMSRVRDYLIGRWMCAEGTDFHASFAGRDEQVFGRPSTVDAEIAALRAVDVDIVRGLADDLFQPSNAYLSVVGPGQPARAARRLLDDL